MHLEHITKFIFEQKNIRFNLNYHLQMADPRLRQITIKTGVVKRLAKEKISYEKEAAQQRKRIDRLKGEGADDHVLRKEEECFQESLMMVPDCQRR